MPSLEMMKLIWQTHEEMLQQPLSENRPLETMKWAYQQICAGKDPWTGLGSFSHAWYGYAKNRRAELVCEPLSRPEQETTHTHRWGAFCAASVEFLCGNYHIPCPDWVYDPYYTLKEPWWHILHAENPTLRESTRRITPAPFARRNIFCDNRLFQNKYEMAEWMAEAIEKGMTDPGEIRGYALQKEKSIHGG
jgi:hypothetical protein